MASELRVNTLKDANGNNSIGMSYVAEGSAKVWGNFNAQTIDGTADLTGVNDSFNVASIVDNGQGDHTVNFTNNMGNDDYSHMGSVHWDATTNGIYTFGLPDNVTHSSYRTTGLLRYESAYVHATANRTNFDGDECCITIHGDLA
tara:strand:- start:108 stop:542 length:435 start_codon:yes stop_codon:yes gene_type:complete